MALTPDQIAHLVQRLRSEVAKDEYRHRVERPVFSEMVHELTRDDVDKALAGDVLILDRGASIELARREGTTP